MAKKSAVADKPQAEAKEQPKAEAKPAARKEVSPAPAQDPRLREKDADTGDAALIAESRKALAHPPEPGMAYFEAPDGFVAVAEESNPHVRERRKGKGWVWLNPVR